MLSNYVLPGDRIELQSVNRSLIENETKRIYEMYFKTNGL